MTEREKQISEMSKIISEMYSVYDTTAEDIAQGLFEKGYRKMDEVTLNLDLGDRSAEEIKQIAEAFNGDIKKQVAKEIYDLIGLIPIPDKHGTHLHIGFENALSAVKIKIAEEYGAGD